jgi:hypothetical protein
MEDKKARPKDNIRLVIWRSVGVFHPYGVRHGTDAEGMEKLDESIGCLIWTG